MIPELSVVVAGFEQAVVEAHTGYIYDIAESVRGLTSDIKSDVFDRLSDDVGMAGDLTYIKLQKLRDKGFAPRCKPRGKPRPVEDVVFNRVFSHFHIVVE